jgi:flavorubredoxin
MFTLCRTKAPTERFHSNRYCAQAACEHCGSALHQEPWCMTLKTEISYVYKIVMDPSALTVGMPSYSTRSAPRGRSKAARVIAPSNK